MAEISKTDQAKKSSLMPTLMAAVLVSGLSVGVGWVLAGQIKAAGMVAKPMAEQGEADDSHKADTLHEEKSEDGKGSEQAGGFAFWGSNNVVKLDPIVSNLGTQGSDWIRIEIGLIVRQGESLSSETDKMDVTEQVITLLRRSTIDDLSGPTAFLQFREDLNDTVRLTTEGRAEAVRILSLVIE